MSWLVMELSAETTDEPIFTVEIDLTGETTKHLRYDALQEYLRPLGIETIPTGYEEINYDFSISVNVHEFNEPGEEVFCTYGYDIYFKDTLTSVDVSIDFDSHVNEKTTMIAMEVLNNRLLYIMKNFPNPAVDTTAANARLFDNVTSKSSILDAEAMTEAAVVSP